MGYSLKRNVDELPETKVVMFKLLRDRRATHPQMDYVDGMARHAAWGYTATESQESIGDGTVVSTSRPPVFGNEKHREAAQARG